MGELLRVTEAAALLRLSPPQVYAMAQRGEIPAIHFGRAVRIPRAELEAWLRERVATENAAAGVA